MVVGVDEGECQCSCKSYHQCDQSAQAYCGGHDAEVFWGIDKETAALKNMLLDDLCHHDRGGSRYKRHKRGGATVKEREGSLFR